MKTFIHDLRVRVWCWLESRLAHAMCRLLTGRPWLLSLLSEREAGESGGPTEEWAIPSLSLRAECDCVSQLSQLSAPTQQQTRPRVIENQLAHAQKPGEPVCALCSSAELCLCCYAIPPLPREAVVYTDTPSVSVEFSSPDKWSISWQREITLWTTSTKTGKLSCTNHEPHQIISTALFCPWSDPSVFSYWTWNLTINRNDFHHSSSDSKSDNTWTKTVFNKLWKRKKLGPLRCD